MERPSGPRILRKTSARRRMLVAAVGSARRALTKLAFRLGVPALATVPGSALMLQKLETVGAHQPIEDAARLFIGGRTDSVPVIADGTPVAVMTRADFTSGLERSGPTAMIGEQTCHDVVTVSPSDSLADVLDQLYAAAPDSIAVVVDRGKPVGVLTVATLEDYVDRDA
ncbi:MAG: CBS domain-containing protein [Kofleriaceae bacterium]